jgi:hypothetical protein
MVTDWPEMVGSRSDPLPKAGIKFSRDLTNPRVRAARAR